jgi:hypothetical protein
MRTLRFVCFLPIALADSDIGSHIGWFSGEGYHDPWRAAAWEIHPVLEIEDLGNE